MITHRLRGVLPSMVVFAALLSLLAAGPATAAPTPNSFSFASQFGREVNLTQVEAHAGPALEDLCTVESGNTCKNGAESAIAGGFTNLEGVAVGPEPNDYVYVTDKTNGRIQVFNPEGAFVRMFGWEVNETKSDQPSATQEEKDVCPLAPGDVCRAAQEPSSEGGAGQIARPVAVAVDQSTGDVFVYDKRLYRVSEYTPTGQFVLTIGRGVNETEDAASGTTEQKNLCTAAEVKNLGVQCKSGEPSEPGSSEPGAFDPEESEHGNILAVGGAQGLLYVGDEERVQEIEPDGKWVRNISLTEAKSGAVAAGGKVKALAVDSSGDLYLVYNNYSGEGSGGIRELGPSGTLTKEIDPTGHVYTFALDALGQLAAVETEPASHGMLFEASTGKRLGTFALGAAQDGPHGFAFSPTGYLYGANQNAQDIERYAPLSVAFLTTGPDTGLTATTATLTGEVNPNEIAETTAWFQYGTSEAMEQSTPAQSFAAVNQSFTLQAQATLIPNQKYYYRVVSEDAHNPAPAPLATGETLSLTTPVVAPQTPGQPSASFVTAQSAILNATLNPEHTTTRYHFEYGACASLAACATLQSTPEESSSVYGAIGSTREITALAPSTTYSFRLVANNEFEEEPGKKLGGPATSVEGSFTTGPAPTITASTGAASAVTPTSAVVSGVVNPDGQQASYTFEVGVYEGASTQYGVVASGPAGSSTTPVEEALPLTGLQPGITYAYRIAIHSGYGGATGATATFTTQGLPSVLSSPASLPMLATPSIAFPTETKESATTTKALTRKQKLTKALKLCKKDRSRAKKTTCEKAAHKKYVVNTNAKGKKKHAGGKKHG